jgi:hypothetical protein
MKAKDFNIMKIFGDTFKKKVFPFTSFGELKNSPKSTILQTEPREVLASNVVEFLNHKQKRNK